MWTAIVNIYNKKKKHVCTNIYFHHSFWACCTSTQQYHILHIVIDLLYESHNAFGYIKWHVQKYIDKQAIHYRVTSWWARWCLKSRASRLFTQHYVQAQIKETSKLRTTGLCEGNSPRSSSHEGPITRKMFPFDEVIMSSSYRVCQSTVFYHLYFQLVVSGTKSPFSVSPST